MISRELVERIIIEVMNAVENQSGKGDPVETSNILVVNATNGPIMEYLHKKGSIYKLEGNSCDIPAPTQEIVFFDVTQDLLVKGALGISDTRESTVLAQGLVKGLGIQFIVSKNIEWVLQGNDQKFLNPDYAKQILKYKTMLEKYGVIFRKDSEFSMPLTVNKGSSNQLTNGQLSFNGKLLTERQVADCEEKVITITKSTIVTPLARDTARDQGKIIHVIG